MNGVIQLALEIKTQVKHASKQNASCSWDIYLQSSRINSAVIMLFQPEHEANDRKSANPGQSLSTRNTLH